MVTLPDVDSVVRMADPVERNRAITRTYHSLSLASAEVLGATDASWTTFGAWASATAGRFIRGEEPGGRRHRAAVAEGNRAIIADIGPRVSRFVLLASAGGDLRARVVDDPLLSASATLAEAFGAYADAAALRDRVPHDADADRRYAQLMLRANVLIADHEQRMADEFVDAAIPLGGIAGIVATRFVRLRIPDGEVDVCRDVPRPSYLGGARWPAELDHLDDPRLRALAASYRQHEDDARHSDAPTWEDVEERMGYIFCFFRAYQRDHALFALPPL